MKIAIASLRPPKVAAVIKIVESLRKDVLRAGEDVEYVLRGVESESPNMPLTREDLMRGAYKRAHNLAAILAKEGQRADFYVGMEGGFDQIPFPTFGSNVVVLEGWVYVTDGQRGAFGATGAIEVPEAIARKVIEEGRELGEIIDQFAEKEGIRDREGAFGVFSRGYLSRQSSFEFALLSAFAPFYNRELYSPTK